LRDINTDMFPKDRCIARRRRLQAALSF
jgi:hypothetical protein